MDFNLTLANTLYGFETGWAGEGNILFGKDYCKCGLCSDAVFQPKRNEYDVKYGLLDCSVQTFSF